MRTKFDFYIFILLFLFIYLFHLQLEQEITRLERLLELPIEPYPKMTPHLMKVLPETRIDSLSPTPDIMRRIRR